MIKSAEHLTHLFLEYKPDIVKMDIEGAERHLLSCSNIILSNINEWLIECHNEELYEKIKEKFQNSNFKVFYISPMEKLKILIAKKLT
jgi:disulfide oxidoreductase YuzD